MMCERVSDAADCEAPVPCEDDVSVLVFEEFQRDVSARRVESVCVFALRHGGERRSVSVVIADDAVVRSLNAKYRGIDDTTDVLSFGFDNAGEYYGEGAAPSEWSAGDEFVLPPTESGVLGEVIVSYPQAVRQAAAGGRSVGCELALLVVHGTLHLMGYDHVRLDDEAVMRDAEGSVIAQIDCAAGSLLR